MNKKVLGFISAISFLFTAFPDFAFAEADRNIVKSAVVSTDIPESEAETGIEMIKDENVLTPMLSGDVESNKFPYYIEFDFVNYIVSPDTVNIYTSMGMDMGVTNIDIQAYVNGKWTNVQSGVVLKWDKNDPSKAEKRTIYFPGKNKSQRFRLVINEANLKKNQFRIDEIEFLGDFISRTSNAEIKKTEKEYFRIAMDEEISLPETVHVFLNDGKETDFKVNWGKYDFTAEGIYTVEGNIPLFEEKAVLVLDVYDKTKKSDAQSGHWADGAISYLTEKGFLGSVDITPDRNVTFADAAAVLFRFNNLNICDDDNKLWGDDFRCELINSAVANGVLEGKADVNSELTRIEAVSALLKNKSVSDKPEVNESNPSFTDISDLSGEQADGLQKAYKIGMISDAEKFNPHKSITVAELSTILYRLDSAGEKNQKNIKEFTDNKSVLVNPNMGLFSYYLDNGVTNYDIHYSNDEYFEDVEGLSNLYIRIPWSVIQPEKDVFDFSIIDGAIQKFAGAGKQISLRFTASETGFVYATPKWVFDEGAKVHWWGGSGGTDQTAPYYADEIFLKYLDEFLAKVAERYDGNPHIAYIDIGTIGLWGEGHTGNSGYNLTPDEVREQFKLYHKNFKKTKIIVLDDLGRAYNDRFINDVKDDIIKYGFGLRNDGYAGVDGKMRFILEEDKTLGDGIWENAPIVMEPEHYSEMKRLDIWGTGIDLAHWIDTVHATYLGLHGYSKEMYYENPEFIEYANMRLGYRIIPEKVELSKEAVTHQKLDMKISWKNIAAAPCYDGAYPALTLKDQNDNIVSVMVDNNFNVKCLPVADPGKAEAVTEEVSFRMHDVLPGGTYKAYLSLGNEYGGVKIKMPIDGDDGGGRYYIGDVSVKGDYGIKVSGQDSAGNITVDFDFYDNNYNYRSYWMYIALRESGENHCFMPGDMYQAIPVDDGFKQAVEDKTPYQLKFKLEIQNKYKGKLLEDKAELKGKKFDVYFVMDTISAGTAPGIMLSDNGREPLIGHAYIDDSLNIIFEPVDN
ncbi:MAG: DUF4832 domain-containing protein [Clostridia bacterium]|nr:DUF4832 domain-containing protein [Clostridia bacterium]